MFLDPRSPNTAYDETMKLFAEADVDNSNSISFQELIRKSDLFINSKMINTAKSLHDQY